jgi:hypothetical protein
MSQGERNGPTVVNLSDVRREKSGKAASNGKPRHLRKQEERAEKAQKAAANRIRTGRTKAQKAQDSQEITHLRGSVDGARRDKSDDKDGN